MKTVAIIPREADSIHFREIPKPSVGEVEGGRSVGISPDPINLWFVQGNNVMAGTVNADRDYFETGVRSMSQAEFPRPGWMQRLPTHPLQEFNRFAKICRLAEGTRRARNVTASFPLCHGGKGHNASCH